MKSLSLQNDHHQRLETSFRNWLELTGYAETSIYGMPNYIREFLHWLEGENKVLIELTAKDIHTYFFHLSVRKKQRRPGALSINYLHKHLQAIKRFSHYLRETDQAHFEVDIILPGQKRGLRPILTKQEIKALYEVCDGSPIGLRDRAMLAVFYGCGLRRNEAVSLDTSDYLKDKKLLYVRKGKNYKERYVPLTKGVSTDIENYLHYGRSGQVKDPLEEAFFLSERGTRINGQSLHLRLKQLLNKAEIPKDAGLHTLRHSIATHLLQSGMRLAHIARFLGHGSLESTQIYTHLSAEGGDYK